MPRLIKRGRSNYTNTDNKLVRDDTLHWGPRGLFNYMWSQADNWQFYVKELVKHSPGGETELRNYLNELEEHGYLKRTPRHDGAGKFGGMDWILSDVGGLNRHAGNPDDGETSQNPGKVTRTPSCGETVERSNRRTVNLTLSNNNNKNYQYKEISNKRKEKNSPAQSTEPHIPYKEIIDYLNYKTKAHYKASSKVNQRLIKARIKEGYTLEDFKTVINNKAFEWQHTDMWKYMRPSTLFGSHFDDYLNENKLQKSVGTIYRNNQGKRVEKGTDWSKKKIDTQSGISTENLKNLFENLDENLANGRSISGDIKNE